MIRWATQDKGSSVSIRWPNSSIAAKNVLSLFCRELEEFNQKDAKKAA